MKKASILLVIIAVICTFFIQFETTSSKKASLEEEGIGDYIEASMVETDFDVLSFVIGHQDNRYHENNNLSFIDGLKNGALVMASYCRDVIVGIICDYLSGFYDKGIIMKIVWGFFGLFIVTFISLITSFLGTIMLAFDLLTQKGSILYHIGYLISLCISVSIVMQIPSED